MTMEHGASQLIRLGDDDLAEMQATVHSIFKKRHPEMDDIPLPGQVLPPQGDLSPTNPEADFIKSLGLAPEQVAQHPDQITKDTKAYIGSLVHYDDQGKIIPIFQRLQGVEIYVSPERKIRRETLKIDGRLKSPEQTLEELKQAGNVSGFAKDMINKTPFTGNRRDVELVWLNGHDVGYTGVTTTTNRFGRGEALGLVKCDQEVGIYQRLTDKDQPMNTGYYMAMETITVRDGDPSVFRLGRNILGLWLDVALALPDDRWDPAGRLVFTLPIFAKI